MSFPEPRPQAPQLPRHLLRTIDCQQGAVRAVRFNGSDVRGFSSLLTAGDPFAHLNTHSDALSHTDRSAEARVQRKTH